MNDEKESSLLVVLGAWLFVVLVVAVIVEAVILMVAFMSADSVECNWFSCVAKKSSSVESRFVVTSQSCFLNGVAVNCSEVDAFGPD